MIEMPPANAPHIPAAAGTIAPVTAPKRIS